MFNKNSLFNETQNPEEFGEIFKYLFFAGGEIIGIFDVPIISTSCGEYALTALNKMVELYRNKKIEVIHLSEELDYLTLVHFRHNNNSLPIIVVSGGAYCCVCNGIEGFPVAIDLFEKGFDVFVFTYSVNEKAINALDELALSINYILKNADNLRIDNSKYYCVGFSAAGHLVSQLGTCNHGYKKYNLMKPSALGLIYPVINLKDYKENGGTTNFLLGANPKEETLLAYSSNYFVDDDYPDSFIIGSDKDNVVNPENFKDMKIALDRHNIRNYYELYDSDVHGFSVNRSHSSSGWIDKFIKFLNNN